MKNHIKLPIAVLASACCTLAEEPKKSRISETGHISEITIPDHASTNVTLYSRLNAGELIHWQYGTTNVTTVAAAPATVEKKRVQIIEVVPVQKPVTLDIAPKQLHAEYFKPASRSLNEAWYTPRSIAKQWASAWETGTVAPTGALAWKNF